MQQRLPLAVHRLSGSIPRATAESAMARLIENNGNGKTAVLDLVTAQPSQTVMAIDESLLHEPFHLSVLPKRWITSAIASLDWDFLC